MDNLNLRKMSMLTYPDLLDVPVGEKVEGNSAVVDKAGVIGVPRITGAGPRSGEVAILLFSRTR